MSQLNVKQSAPNFAFTILFIPSLQAVCQGPRGSDVYHLAANLLDRYLLYETAPKDFEGVAGACAMISMKIRRARKECPSYEQLRYYFRVSERQIRVSG